MPSVRLPESFIFTKTELDTASPSRQCGISVAEEAKRREEACLLCQACCAILQLPHTATVTAFLLLHRFYAKRSFTIFPDTQWVVCTCIFLAAKLEEDPRRASDVLNAMHRLLLPASDATSPPSILKPFIVTNSQDEAEGHRLISRSRELLLAGQEYYKAKERLISLEQEVLRALHFQVGVVPPHRFLLNFCKYLRASRPLTQLAYAALNDCLVHTNLCLLHPPAVLAASALNVAALLSEVTHELPSEWWTHLDDPCMEMSVLEDIGHVLLDVYTRVRVLPTS